MEFNSNQQKIIQAIEAAKEKILSVSHQIHAHPELGSEEVFSSGLLIEMLEASGFSVERGYAGIRTAFCARKRKSAGSHCGVGARVAFLAEYDALPDIGHGCGHNVIGTTSMAAGIGLGAVIDDIPGEVWVIGTPAEETDGAKAAMVEKKAFDEIDTALMIHPHNANFIRTESLAMDAIRVTFYGKPSHAAAAPWDGKNALDALIATFNNINALRQQMRPDGRIHGIVTNGGAAPNVIPEKTEGKFYVRAKTRKYLNELVEKFKDCAQAGALASGCQVEFFNYEASFDDMVNNMTLAERMTDYAQTLGSAPFKNAPDSYGSVDMGNVSHVIPAIHVLVDITEMRPLSPHTRDFAAAAATSYADSTLLRSAKALALTGYDVLTDEKFLQAAKEEFKNSI